MYFVSLYSAANLPLKKTRRIMGQVSFHKEFWDRHWGSAIQLKGSLSRSLTFGKGKKLSSHATYFGSGTGRENASHFSIKRFNRDGWNLILLFQFCNAHLHVIDHRECLTTFSCDNHKLWTLL